MILISFTHHNIALHAYRSAQSACPAACVPLAWWPMEMVAVSLKTFVHVSITERNISLGRALKMAATHGTIHKIHISGFFLYVQSDRLT